MANKYQEMSKAKEKRNDLMKRRNAYARNNIRNNMNYLVKNHSAAAEKAFSEGKRPYERWKLTDLKRVANRILVRYGYKVHEIQFIMNQMEEHGANTMRKFILKSSHEKHHINYPPELVAFFEVDEVKLTKFANNKLGNRTCAPKHAN